VNAEGLSGLTVNDCSTPPGFAPGFWDAYVKPDQPCGCSQAAVIRAFKSGAVTSPVA
jgi:hypothetical protein